MGLVLVAKTPDAIDVFYDDSVSGPSLLAQDVQTAIDILKQTQAIFIISHTRNAAGSLLTTFDTYSGMQIEAPPQVVFDNNGDVVLRGGYVLP